ncbi:LPXTG cell wall anchor domain-containing protein, partial [Streptococcus ovuberis]
TDTDGDGISDDQDPDDDNDGVNDKDEELVGTNPKNPMTDGKTPDGELDSDNDGIKNKDESDPNGTTPTDKDQDGKPDIITPKPSQTTQPGNDKGNRKTVSLSGSSEQSSKQLPKTGDSSEVTSLVAGFGLLALIAVMIKRRRKED